MCPSAAPSSLHHFHAGSPTLCFVDGETEARGHAPALAISLQPCGCGFAHSHSTTLWSFQQHSRVLSLWGPWDLTGYDHR